MMGSSFCRYALCNFVAAAMLAGCGGHASGGAVPIVNSVADSLPYNRTFKYTGRRQSFVVQPNVTKLTVVARGAGSAESRGGRIYAIIPVNPGERLFIFVGGAASGSIGGFNGGANGGQACGGSCAGTGGGGASDVREGGYKMRNRVLVAGGAGGQGGSWPPSDNAAGGIGGKGGGSAGGAGAGGGYAENKLCAGGGGSGGTQRAGGSGGLGSFCYYESYSGNPGAKGRLGSGGAGGEGGPYLGHGPGGGGGGGGYYGGGGGGAGSSFFSYEWGAGGGGGGGPSYIEPSAIRFESWPGWKNAKGDGLVVFSWQ
jgi:hypothetical protein